MRENLKIYLPGTPWIKELIPLRTNHERSGFHH
jgi:hypothetical protein